MKYIFPRQFGLHNVFTCKANYRDTSQPFKDYTLREQEIARDRSRKMSKTRQSSSSSCIFKDVIPKRLRGHAVDLVRRLRILHRRCSYVEWLRYYCPIALSNDNDDVQAHQGGIQHQELSINQRIEKTNGFQEHHTTNGKASNTQKSGLTRPTKIDQMCFTDLATPNHQVSAFCRAVMNKVIPNDLWGEGETQTHNKHIFLRQIDRFICLRRFESLTLHEVLQDMKVCNFVSFSFSHRRDSDIQIADVKWLRPPNVRSGNKMSQTDFNKRRELLAELIYYIFDSFLILLIRTNFHVTESNVDRNRLHYFRHDVWRKLSEPALIHLKTTMFEDMKSEDASKILAGRQIGYSQVRLLPKKLGARPITNLKRRMQITVKGKVTLGKSINSVMRPVFNVLNFERVGIIFLPSDLEANLFPAGEQP